MGATLTQPLPTATPVTVRNVLFATDFTATSEAALPFALALAKHYGAALFVTHILPPEPRYELPLEPAPDAINPRKQQAQDNFDALLSSGVLGDVVHEPILRCGELWQTMQDVIASRNIDLIVTGTHGRQGLRKLILGSVAEIIFRNAACPVLTVGPLVSNELVRDGFRRVLFATDFSTVSLAALPYVYSLARAEGAQLTIMHVVALAPPAIDAVVVPELGPEFAEEARRRLEEIVTTQPPVPLAPEAVVVKGDIAESITYAAAERKVAMIVLGVRHKGALAAHFPWSIADAVACRAHCPVLTVRGE